MPYDIRYESNSVRGDQDPLPWDLLGEIRSHARKSDVLLDVGCGTAFKLLQLVGDVGVIYGLEPSMKMMASAQENIRKAGISNLLLINGRAEELPFEDCSFNIVTCMVSPHITSEVYRVLKPNGYAILEKIGDRDKWNLKEEFGSDEQGLRGQFSHFGAGERARSYENEFENLFSEVSVQNGFWKTYYSLEGLCLLLSQAPIIRNFDRDSDGDALRRIQDLYTTPRGIETTQNKILIVARK